MSAVIWTKRRLLALLLAAVLLLGTLTGCGARNGVIAAAVYPKQIKHGSQGWAEFRREQTALAAQYRDGLTDFIAATMPEYLADENENRVYAPLNIYLALAMLAETSAGESRGQILALLGAENIETLRTAAGGLWNAAYCDDGAAVSLLGSSVWLRDDMAYNKATLDTLALEYYASSFRGEMGSDGYNKQLQSWLDDQTHGLLTAQAGAVNLEPAYAFALATTAYFKADWARQFREGDTAQEPFHAKRGDMTADFMHKTAAGRYYRGEGFTASAMPFRTGGDMWFVLPDEGREVAELMTEPLVQQLIAGAQPEVEGGEYTIRYTVPKFDVQDTQDLIDGLQQLGVTRVFDPAAADFSPLLAEDGEQNVSGLWVDKISHAARVKVDEEGVEAAAFTVIGNTGAGAPPSERVDFTLDRPFLFAVTSPSGLPLFLGVVNDPAGS